MQAMRLLPFLIAGILMGVLGCTVCTAPAPIIFPPPPSPTPLDCTQNPPNLSLQVTFGMREESFQSIRMEGKGFALIERLSIVIEGRGVSYTLRSEVSDLPVNADGSFTDSQPLQLDEPNMQWHVFVIHQRGTACASFTTQ
jgi:hypothetical protein